MSELPDAHRSHREQLLASLSAQLQELGIQAMFGVLQRYYDLYGFMPEGLTGLVVDQPDGPGRMQVTVVGVRRTVPPGEGGLSPDRRTWVRDLDILYDLGGDIAFEITTFDDRTLRPSGTNALWAARRLTHDEQAVIDAIRLWYGYRDSLRATPPKLDPDRRRAQLARQIAARESAAGAPSVRLAVDASEVPEKDLAQLDHAQLCYHFPRDRHGRYARSVVVVLARYDTKLAKRGPWLAVRADGDSLVIGIEALIGENQDHRWDNLPWLWSTAHRDTPPETRWQLPNAEHVRPIVDLLDQGALTDALTLCGVDVDTRLAALLAGYPISYEYARYTDGWVNRLYEQLPNCAPWRLAAAHRVWEAQRDPIRRRRPTGEPIVLFGLKGLNRSAKPVVSLETRDGVPRLIMDWTASNARLPRALWERPVDLDAALLTTNAG
ncbi:hypothetical protein [Allorhizocola rhizosphaerae]|uniref:hypothetical protein n=1 Tax=Allorhizocola rhizosphaerae TaxID=1872709 RepID=UPI0013C30187|nr:hypothetical protein [Allorhizocola rhizosphaerae]